MNPPAASTTCVHSPGGCRPTPAQILLLRAALLEAPAALPAWADWNRSQNLDHLDAGSFRLLGLLYRNLLRLGADPSDSKMPRLRGIYRHFWTRNQLTLQCKGELLHRLADRGIPCLLLKGAALTLTIYRDFGTRPMDDFDLMVPREHVHETMALLEDLGWKSEVHHPRDLPLSIHACSFRNAGGAQVDLHWRLCHLPATAEFERTVWHHVLPVTLQDVPAAIPSFTDCFLQTCAHGPQYKPVPPVRWLADAFLLLRHSGGTLDWDRIAGNAPAVGAVKGVRDTLTFLRDHLGQSVSQDALEKLERIRIPLQERWEGFFLSRPTPTPWHRMPLDLSHHLRCTRRQPWLSRLRGFKVYFRHANNLTPGQFTTHYRAQFGRWLRVWLPWHLRNLPRMFVRPEPGSLRTLPADTFENFHEVEPLRHRLFRWSKPRAALHLQFPPGARFRIELDTAGLRRWKTDLSLHLQFSFNGTPVPCENIKPKKGVVRIAVPDFEETLNLKTRQTLAWVCEPVTFEGDARAVGLPIVAARVICIKRSTRPQERVASPGASLLKEGFASES